MSKKLIFLMFVVLVLGLAHIGWGTTKIIIVTNNPGDEADYTPFLRNLLGYDVSVEAEDDKYIDPLDAAAKANLEAADLVIVSRRTSSGNFTAEVDFWNGLATPMILHSSFLLGDDRWRWLPGGTQNADLTDVAVVDESSLIFDGVTITDNQVKIFSSLVTGLDVSNQDSAGNSTKIATPAGSNRVMIGHWDAGTEYYPGSGQIAGGPRIFFGMRTDEFFPFVTDDGKKMLGNAIIILLGRLRGDPIALDPGPADAETDVPRDVVLTWTPGESANTHDVYFGSVFDDVNNASRTDPRDVLVNQGRDANTFAPGRLEFDRTYYWRVDEVNAPPDSAIFKGAVWSFTTEPVAYAVENITATASSSAANKEPENTVNGSGLDDSGLLHDDDDRSMWLSGVAGPQPTWIEFQFDKAYKLHEMWVWNSNGSLESVIGFGFKDVSIEYSVNGTDYMTLGATHEFARAPGVADYAHNTTVDTSGVAAKYVKLTANSNWGGIFSQYGLSEVSSFYIPLRAREPSPDSGATDVAVDVVLGWRAGREAAQHDVFLSSDEQAVIDGTAPVTTVTETSYGPFSLDLGQTYHWKVSEVNIAESPTTWDGDVWNFTTPESLVVDDFESYNDIAAGEEGSNSVYLTWTDGFDNPSANGSTIGYVEAFQPSMETGIVHGGNQSVPLMYDNSVASLSEVTVDPANLPIGRDWTVGSLQTLVLWFHGSPGNAVTEQMYVKLNGAKVVYPGGAADIAEPRWKQWNIDLAALGISLSSVTELSIGFERTGASGGTGTVFIDDILLYRSAPEIVVPSEEI